MAADLHGDGLRYSEARTMLRMAVRRRSWKSRPGHAGPCTGAGPSLPDVPNGPAAMMEDERGKCLASVGSPVLPCGPSALGQLPQLALQCERPALAVLRRIRQEANEPRIPVHIGPRERCHFALPPTRQVGKSREVLQVLRQVSTDGLEVPALEEPLPRVMLGQQGYVGAAGEPLLTDGQPEGAPDHGQLPIDRRRLAPSPESELLVPLDPCLGHIHRSVATECGPDGLAVSHQRIDRPTAVVR